MTDYTSIVIRWLDYQEYSRMHWSDVAKDILLSCDANMDIAVVELARALRNFHHTYRDAVIKPDNLLCELVDTCFNQVDWEAVARSRWRG